MSARERRRKRRRLAAGAGLGIGAALGASATAEAADFTVSNLNDAGAGSLRQAILDSNTAPGADRVLFQSGLTGTITLTGGQITIDGSLEILGPGSGQLTVSGNGTSRIFYSYPSAPQNVTISGLTLMNGVALTGGAIRTALVNLTLSNAVVTGNQTSGVGGNGAAGVYTEYGSLAIQGSTISGNTAATGRGGAIRTYRTPTSIQNSTISGNKATEANAFGGGVYTFRDSLTVVGSTISGNTSTDDGGGIHGYRTSITIERSTISGNTAGSAGNGDGGGIYAFSDPLVIRDSTIAGNAAGRQGGGIDTFAVTPDPTLQNTIVADNTAPSGPDLLGDSGDVFPASFSLIENPSGVTVTGGPNITGQDPKLGPLADNGGPTLTQALLAGSPALDKGSATGADQRGAPRPFDLTGILLAPGGNSADIGSYEQVLCAGRLVNRIGTAGKNTLVGTPGADGILGLGGKDKLTGLAGKDSLCGGSGPDKLKGGGGNDKLLGQAGNDILIGGKGKDKLRGGKGKDKQKQ
jgi:hypothetical protein